MKHIEYRVEGPAPMPLDMLRYDHSWPATTDDAITIASMASGDTPPRHKTQVLLRGLTCHPQRWASFQWTVIEQRKVEAVI